MEVPFPLELLELDPPLRLPDMVLVERGMEQWYDWYTILYSHSTNPSSPHSLVAFPPAIRVVAGKARASSGRRRNGRQRKTR